MQITDLDSFTFAETIVIMLTTKECVKRALKKKTIILVTHQIDFLHEADSVLVCFPLIVM